MCVFVFKCLTIFPAFHVSCQWLWDEREVMSSLRLPGFFYAKFLCLFPPDLISGACVCSRASSGRGRLSLLL